VNTELPQKSRRHQKAIYVAVSMLVTASVSGYFMGLRQTASTISQTQIAAVLPDGFDEPAKEHDAPRVVEYRRLAEVNYKANAEWTNHLAKLVVPPREAAAPPPATAAQAAEALKERATRRAYDGAPPIVPHPINQHSSFDCLACHGEGKQIKDRFAPKMSHEFMHNCTQCHVPGGGNVAGAEPFLREPLAANQFIGAPAPGKGARAYPGAPPVIPHATALRTDCLSCHGPNGNVALRTPHPYQQSCTQCHAPSADADQRIFFSREWLEVNPHTRGGGQ
jgi:nitrate reductase (cytochrome), electron transfer subunit